MERRREEDSITADREISERPDQSIAQGNDFGKRTRAVRGFGRDVRRTDVHSVRPGLSGIAPAIVPRAVHPTVTPGCCVLKILKAAFNDFGKDECGTRAAALAYYTIFALPPLLILLVAIAGKIWGPDQVQRSLEGQFAGMIGQSGAEQVHGMIAHANKTGGRGTLATILGFVGLILGATGAFMSLQDALNHAWEVKPDPKAGGIKNFITKRLLSLGMVLGLGFLLAAS